MMEHAVRELKGEAVAPEVEPEIRLGIPAFFPNDYIPDANQRLFFYKRLASLAKPEELDEIKAELKDRFGPYGQTVENLFLVMELRRVLKIFLVQQISASDGGFTCFPSESPVKEKLRSSAEKPLASTAPRPRRQNGGHGVVVDAAPIYEILPNRLSVVASARVASSPRGAAGVGF
jgi:transcription-repair coupling factor (superfamily II helicase)